MAAATVAAEITALPEPRGPLRRLCGDLARRVRLLAPLLDDPSSSASPPLADALRAARDLLHSVQHGSKIYQVPRFLLFYCNTTTTRVRRDDSSIYPIQSRRPREAGTVSSANSRA